MFTDASRPRPARRVVLRTALAAVTVALATSGIAAHAGAVTVAPPVGSHTSVRETLVLPTGERLTLARTPHGVSILHPAGGPRFVTQRVAGHTYAIPVSELAAVGSGRLSRSLFDVTRLMRRPAGGMPIAFDYSGAVPRVPGVSVASHTGGHATGRLSSPTRFASAVRTDATGTARDIGLPAQAAIAPDFPQRDLTIHTIDPKGVKIDGADALVVNTDDWHRYSNDVGIRDGEGKVSVPIGHYALLVTEYVAPSTPRGDETFLTTIVQDVHVTGSGASVTADLRKATVAPTPTVHTPRPSDLSLTLVSIAILDQHGQEGTIDTFQIEPGDLYLTPTPSGRHGGIRVDDVQELNSPPSATTPYDYELSFLSDRVPARYPARHLTGSDYATVQNTFYTDGHQDQGDISRLPDYPYQDTGLNGPPHYTPFLDDMYPTPVPMPGTTTDYLFGRGGVRWYGAADQYGTNSYGIVTDQLQPFRAGHSYSEGWFRGLLAPGIPARVGGESFPCLACRTADRVEISPYESDSSTGHVFLPFAGPGQQPYEQRLRVFDNDGRVAEAYNGAVSFAAPAASTTYRIVDDVDRTTDGYGTSTPARTAWTVRTAAGDSPLPAGFTCPLANDPGDCATVPLLTLRTVLPTGLTGTVAAGTATAVVHVGHVEGAVASAITDVTAQTSTDGAAYRDATVTDVGGGRYRVELPDGSVGQKVSIRLHAEDAAGSTVTQTVHDAYRVAT